MELYKKVRLLTDKYSTLGVKKFNEGYIIGLYPEGYCEIEFSDPDTGISYAQIVTKPGEFEVLE